MARFTSLPPEQLEALILLIPQIFSDYRDWYERRQFEAIYCMAETEDNEDLAFRRAIELADVGAMKALYLCGGGTEAGYAGFDHSLRRLRDLGYDERKVPIKLLPFVGDPNTLSEARALAALGIKGDIGVLAPPLHIIRAFATVVTVFVRQGLPARIYAVPGHPAPWDAVVTHSNGAGGLTRAGWLKEEIKRLEKYQASEYGGMLLPTDLLQYMNYQRRL